MSDILHRSGALVRLVAVSAALVAVAAPAPTAGLAEPAAPGAGAGPAFPRPAAATQPMAPAYRWPLDGEPAVTRRFDPPERRWLAGHRGVDLAGEPGAVVRSAGAGTVYFAGPVAGTGVVSVEHPGGLRTTYQPVAPVVSAGDWVAAGDPIGTLEPGHAGCTVPACLHWGLRRGELYLDPLSLLGLGPVRLLPLPPVRGP